MASLFKRLVEKIGLSARAQNLTDDEKPLWRHGRAWIRRATEDGWQRLGLRFEWSHLMHPATRLSVDVDPDECEITLSWAIPGVSHFLTVTNLPRALFDALPMNYRRSERRYAGGRTISLRIFDKAIWWSFWGDEMEHRHDDPRWMHGSWHPLDSILGGHRYSSEEIARSEVSIPMPERSYPATVKLTRDRWERPRWPRWPFATERRRAHVDIPGGIGHPGKGENSWDCGDDATCGLTTTAKTVEEAIGKVVSSMLRDRMRYGGRHEFEPSPPVPQDPTPVAGPASA